MNLQAQFLAYGNKVFHLNRLVRAVGDGRPFPLIPTRPVLVSLLLAAVLRVDSYLAVARQTQRRQFGRRCAAEAAPARKCS